MNGKSVDKDEAAFNNDAIMGDDSRLETASETRKERIRRLNRERQRRRRQKLKLSRQVESGLTPTTAPGNVNLFETQHEPNHEDAQTVNAELPTPTGQRKTKPTRRRQSPRKLKIKQENEFEEVSSDLSSTNPTTQPEVCHENANEIPGTSSDTVCVQIPVPLVATEIEVEDENYFDDDEEEFLDEELDLSDEEDEERAKAGENYRRRCDQMSEEDLASRREYYRDRERKKRQTMTPNEVSARREKQRELKRKQKERMTPDQIEALRARYREWRRKRKETMTPEQLEIIRRGNRERQRRRRERLGIRKRAATSQPKGVSDAVLLGIKNRHGRSLSETEAIFNIADAVPTTMSVKRGRAGNQRSSSTSTGRKHLQGPQAVPVAGPQAMALPITQPVVATGHSPLPSVSTLAGPNTATPTHQSQTTVPGGIPPLQTTPLPGLSTIAQGPAQITTSVSATGPSGAIYQSMPLPGVQGFLHSMPVVSGAQGTMLTGFQGTPMQGMGAGTFIPPTMNKDGQVLHSISTLLPVAPLQGISQGLTFLTPVTGAGPMATMQGFPDPRYVMAAPVRPQNPSQLASPTQQATGLVQAAETVSIAMPQEPVQQVGSELKISASEIQPTLVAPDAPPPTLTQRGKGRGRKRAATVAAADVLASLSAGSPGNTPMASMLSAMASAKGESANQQIPPQPAPTQEQTTSVVVAKGQNIEQENYQVMSVGATMPTQQINQAAGAMLGVAPAVPGKTPLNQPTAVTQQVSAERKSYTTLTTAVTSLPMDMNANTFAGFPAQNVAGFPAFKGFETLFANIPNANVYRGPYGMPIVDTRSGNLMGFGQLPEQQLNIGNRISVAIETDEIKRATVATNTGDVESDADMNKVNVESVGTMTDSLYKSSVGTETDAVDTEDASGRTEALKESETRDKSELIEEETGQWEKMEGQDKNEEKSGPEEQKSDKMEMSEKMEICEDENPPENNKLLTANHERNVETAADLMDADAQCL